MPMAETYISHTHSQSEAVGKYIATPNPYVPDHGEKIN